MLSRSSAGQPSALSSLSSVVYGLWSAVYGLWSVVYGLWSVVCGLWSAVYGQEVRSFEPGPWAKAHGSVCSQPSVRAEALEGAAKVGCSRVLV